MTFLALALLCIGGMVALISFVWSLALAFQRNVFWGLTVLCLPVFGNFAFLLARWREARAPFVLGLSSMMLMGAAYAAMPLGSISIPAHTAMAAFHRDTTLQKEIGERDMAAARKAAQVEAQLFQLKERENAILERKASLRRGDEASAHALTVEIKRYNAELQPLLAQTRPDRLASK